LIRSIAVTIGATIAALIAANLAVGGYVARRVIAPRSKKTAIPVEIVGKTITVPSTADTAQSGRYGIWLDDGAHAAVGDILLANDDQVTRELLAVTAEPGDKTTAGIWTSQYIPSPEDVGTSHDVLIPLTLGETAEAWQIEPGAETNGRWTIHIHGLRSSRHGALRSTPPTINAGWTSLVVSYAGDDERLPADGRPSSLGTREWADVDDALQYAVSHGAREIVLVAWSMGATISLLALENSPAKDRVVGLILIAPALEWFRVIANATSGAHLPRSVAAAAVHVLRSPLGAKALRLSGAVDAGALNWVDGRRAGVTLPTLLLHSRHDPVVPFSGSEAFAATHPEAQLVAFSSTGHCNEPNQDPKLFNESIDTWLKQFDTA
jgi:pimeloyl-ACP methyl ester carboxylesterase